MSTQSDVRTPHLSSLDGTYGWRARIGFITVAATVETPVYEFQLIAPSGLVLVSAGLSVTKVDQSSLARVVDQVGAAAAEIARYHIQHIVVSGNPVAYMSEQPSEMARRIEELVASAANVPATFEWGATLDALRHFDATRIAVATPFTDAHNERLAGALEAEGFKVAAIVGLGLDSNPEITTQPVGAAYRTARAAAHLGGSADAIYIACPRWPVVPAIQPLENDTGLPVVASVPAWTWSVMRQLDLQTSVEGFGSLLSGGTVANRRGGGG